MAALPLPHQSTTLDPSLLRPDNSLTRQSPQPRQNLPRLQHSPSLPNLWLPPHFGPIPQRLMNLPRDNLHEPATPPSLVTNFNLPETNPPSPSFDTPLATRTECNPKKAFQHVDRERSHTLLTPPLTPSSSIRTSTSIETNATSHHSNDFTGDKLFDHPIVEASDPENASRFVRLQNVSPQVTATQLENVFLCALRDIESDKPSSSLIKCIYKKHLDKGIVLILFFDLRVAAQAKVAFSRKFIFPTDFVAEGRDSLSCDFLTLDEVLQLAGHSHYLDDMESALYVYVEGEVPCVKADHPSETTSTTAPESKPIVESGSGLMALLTRVLASCGTLRLFAPAHDKVPTQLSDGSPIYVVDYFDIRDSKRALQKLNGVPFYESTIRILKAGDSVPLREREPDESPANSPHDIPFPSPEPSHRHTQSNVHDAGRPCAHRRLLSKARLEAARPRSISVDYAESPTSNDSPVTPSSTNPAFNGSVYVYSSSPPAPHYHYAYPVQPAPDIYVPRNSSYTYVPASKATPLPADNTYGFQYPRTMSPRVPPPDRPGHTWVVGQEGLYNSPDLNMNYSFPPRNSITPQQAPILGTNHGPFYPTQTSAYVGSYAQSGGFPREGDIVQSSFDGTMHVVVKAASSTEPPLLMPLVATSQGLVPINTAVNGGEIWLGSPITPRSAPVVDTGALNQLQRDESSKSPEDRLAAHVGVDSRARRSASNSPDATLGRSHTSKPGTKNNALDIPAIEAGLDTRTTVMIRNIPNKMSDKHLIAYIDSVRPRRIDFLYLRMDFKNGCNVGYAFVNFITVEDLLAFAKEKLGKKWNMFASEKVLEMSYADYQGKEAQVEKFKNSSIMDEREEWRPKIFRSEPGSEQGLPEPFPSPTHLRRKQLSSNNRMGLFPRNPKAT